MVQFEKWYYYRAAFKTIIVYPEKVFKRLKMQEIVKLFEFCNFLYNFVLNYKFRILKITNCYKSLFHVYGFQLCDGVSSLSE